MTDSEKQDTAQLIDSSYAMDWPEFQALCDRMGLDLGGDVIEVDLHFLCGQPPTFTVRKVARDHG